jgi:hypothetical protein
MAAVVHCGSDDDSLFPNGGAPCGDVYKGLCGKACTADAECPSGLYCSTSKKCTADCSEGHVCAKALTCGSNGRCGDGFAGLADGGDSDASPIGCAGAEVALAKVVPNVLFLLDQSSSMFLQKFPTGNSNNCTPDCRWTTLKDVLIGPANNPGGLLKELQGQAAIAVELYSSTDGVADGDDSFLTGPTDNVCPRFNGKAFNGLTFDVNAYPAVDALLRPATVDDDTPTGPAVRTVVGLDGNGAVADQRGFAGLASDAPKVLVLVTDGEPTICGESIPSPAGQDQVVAAVQATFKQNIRTVVIAIGDAVGAADKFNAVANAGQGLDPTTGDAGAILPSTTDALVTALKKAVQDARACTYDLSGQVEPGQEHLGVVTVNGAPVPYDAAGTSDNGWHLATPSRIELVGQACTTIKTTPDAVLSVRFPCGAVSPK